MKRTIAALLLTLAFIGQAQVSPNSAVSIPGFRYYATNEFVHVDFYDSRKCFYGRTVVAGKSETPFGQSYLLRVPCSPGFTQNLNPMTQGLPTKGSFSVRFDAKGLEVWGYRLVLGVQNGGVSGRVTDFEGGGGVSEVVFQERSSDAKLVVERILDDAYPEVRPGVWLIGHFFTESYAPDAFKGMPKGWNPIGKAGLAMQVEQAEWTFGNHDELDHRHIVRATVVVLEEGE